MVEEARLSQEGSGLAPTGEGWFVVNVLDTAWIVNEHFGARCFVESGTVPFPQTGFTLGVLQPGQPNGLYHRESNQEDFLVLAGRCLLLVAGEEHRLSAGDFFHCPPDCEHILVGDGDAPCVFMTGSRTRETESVQPRSELALRHGAGVPAETARPADAYASLPKWESAPAPSELSWR